MFQSVLQWTQQSNVKVTHSVNNTTYIDNQNYKLGDMFRFTEPSSGQFLKQSNGRGQLKCDGTRAETRFRLLAKRTSPFKSAGASVQSTTGSWGVRISGSNAGYTMFEVLWRVLATTPFASFPFTSPPVCPRLPSHFNWSLHSASAHTIGSHTVYRSFWHKRSC
jgi:hypothetical protein